MGIIISFELAKLDIEMKRISLLLFLIVLTCNSLAQTVVLVDPAVIESPAVGEDLKISIKIRQGNNIAGYQFTLEFDGAVLEYISIVNADFLSAGAFAISPKVNDGKVTLAATSLAGGTNGDGTLAKATFKVLRKSNSVLKLSGVKLVDLSATAITSQTVDGEVVVSVILRQHPRKIIPEATALLQNYPNPFNPFNPETWMPFELNQASEVSMTIYNVIGTAVRTFSIGYLKAGRYVSQSRAIYWDGNTGTGERVASGIYFYQIQAGDYIGIRKMVILK